MIKETERKGKQMERMKKDIQDLITMKKFLKLLVVNEYKNSKRALSAIAQKSQVNNGNSVDPTFINLQAIQQFHTMIR